MKSFILHWLPIVFSVLMIATFIVSYVMSTTAGVVSPLFPYISDTGTLPPQSCIFGQMLNVCAFLAILTAYCWYLQQMHRYEDLISGRCAYVAARLTLALGILSAVGLSIVGNFQETNVEVVHLVGASMAFGLGTLYIVCICEACIKRLETPRWLLVIRIMLAIISSIAAILLVVFASLKGRWRKYPPQKWNPGDEGYLYHVISCVSEWLLAASFLFFFTTMVYELRQYTLDPVKVSFRYGGKEQQK